MIHQAKSGFTRSNEVSPEEAISKASRIGSETVVTAASSSASSNEFSPEEAISEADPGIVRPDTTSGMKNCLSAALRFRFSLAHFCSDHRFGYILDCKNHSN